MQAVVITAYREPEQVYKLAECLSKKFLVYIHFDKKMNAESIGEQHFERLLNVHVYSLFHVNWGGVNHLWAILYLCREALKNKDVSYVHIISGEDYPCKRPEEIYAFFEEKEIVGLHFTDISRNKLVHTQKYYAFVNIINYKKIYWKIFVRALWLLQKIFKVNRLKKLSFPLYLGLVWGDVPRGALEYCFDFVHKNPEFLVFLEYGSASEEVFFGSILMQSDYWKQRCVQNNFRYIKWEKRNGSYPAILEESDFAEIAVSDAFFVRKVRLPFSEGLLRRLNQS